MRIIAGKFGGRKLKVFPAKQMRPTTDRVREAVFSTLLGIIDLENCAAIDLYAGTGSMGLEAFSRGAKPTIFIEQDKRLCHALRENADMLGISSGLHIINGALPSVLKRAAEVLNPKVAQRLFLIDPPYTAHPGKAIVTALLEHDLITPLSVVVLGCPKSLNLDFSKEEFPASVELKDHRIKTYGDTIIHFLLF
ncbi:MAG: 16S rRNA (guanine(966)-N(2))-methyltransferase RsmD [Bdellovibrionales bacterium]|nr:16S rRNA (guanine(966)-N(2))-methyltransferase RsmD [Bdellovibrionales bacterium]